LIDVQDSVPITLPICRSSRDARLWFYPGVI
jgi:hypothetical protein